MLYYAMLRSLVPSLRGPDRHYKSQQKIMKHKTVGTELLAAVAQLEFEVMSLKAAPKLCSDSRDTDGLRKTVPATENVRTVFTCTDNEGGSISRVRVRVT